MVVKWEVAMKIEANGIREICPSGGWSSIEGYLMKLKCEWCACVLDRVEVVQGRLVDDKKHKRESVRVYKCGSCERPARVFIDELLGLKKDKKTILMRMQADGLQPEGNFLCFTSYCNAIDLDGNVSAEFILDIGGDGPESAAIMDLEFTGVTAYARAIKKVEVEFNRV